MKPELNYDVPCYLHSFLFETVCESSSILFFFVFFFAANSTPLLSPSHTNVLNVLCLMHVWQPHDLTVILEMARNTMGNVQFTYFILSTTKRGWCENVVVFFANKWNSIFHYRSAKSDWSKYRPTRHINRFNWGTSWSSGDLTLARAVVQIRARFLKRLQTSGISGFSNLMSRAYSHWPRCWENSFSSSQRMLYSSKVSTWYCCECSERMLG